MVILMFFKIKLVKNKFKAIILIIFYIFFDLNLKFKIYDIYIYNIIKILEEIKYFHNMSIIKFWFL